MFKRLSKIVALVLMLGLTVSCATKLAPKASDEKQESVKQEVLNLLKKEYNQPFKIVDYSYSYDTHYPAGNCSGDTCTVRKFGTYKFKIQAVDNPIIIMDFKLEDTKTGYEWLKKHSIKHKYCVVFSDVYEKYKKDDKYKNDILKAKNICDSRGENYYKNV